MQPDKFYEKDDLSIFAKLVLPLKPFYEETILNKFKNQFYRLAHFTRKNRFDAARIVLGMLFDV